MSKLKYYKENDISKDTSKKIYTLKENIDGKPTKNAHYKFIKIKDAPTSAVSVSQGKFKLRNR